MDKKDVSSILECDPKFFEKFTVVVCTKMSEAVLAPLGEILWKVLLLNLLFLDDNNSRID